MHALALTILMCLLVEYSPHGPDAEDGHTERPVCPDAPVRIVTYMQDLDPQADQVGEPWGIQ